MSIPEIDSPFAEKKSNRLVWIIPSVVLHVIVLIVWLTLPEAPPREPTERKLMINSQQAEQLKQHVEDANLVILQSQVSELQAIKHAMAQIRESKMAQLRSFEEQMVVDAPKDASELFNRLLQTQVNIMGAYQQMLESAQVIVEKESAAKALLEEDKIKEAHPLLVEIKSLREDTLAQVNAVKNETAQIFALISTAEVKLDWVRDTSIERPFSDLKAAIESAQESNRDVSGSLRKRFTGSSSRHLNSIVTKHEEYADALSKLQEGPSNGHLKNKVKHIHSMIRGIFGADLELGLITEAMKAHVEVTQKTKALISMLARKVANGEVAQP